MYVVNISQECYAKLVNIKHTWGFLVTNDDITEHTEVIPWGIEFIMEWDIYVPVTDTCLHTITLGLTTWDYCNIHRLYRTEIFDVSFVIFLLNMITDIASRYLPMNIYITHLRLALFNLVKFELCSRYVAHKAQNGFLPIISICVVQCSIISADIALLFI